MYGVYSQSEPRAFDPRSSRPTAMMTRQLRLIVGLAVLLVVFFLFIHQSPRLQYRPFSEAHTALSPSLKKTPAVSNKAEAVQAQNNVIAKPLNVGIEVQKPNYVSEDFSNGASAHQPLPKSKPSQSKTSQSKPSQGKTSQGKTSQSKTLQSKPSQVKTSQSKVSQGTQQHETVLSPLNQQNSQPGLFMDLPAHVQKKIDTLDWSKFAYTQYVTDGQYLCNAVMIFEALSRLGSKADLVMVYPSYMLHDPLAQQDDDLDGISRLLIQSRDEYGVKLSPIDVSHRRANDCASLPMRSSSAVFSADQLMLRYLARFIHQIASLQPNIIQPHPCPRPGNGRPQSPR